MWGLYTIQIFTLLLVVGYYIDKVLEGGWFSNP
jgi:hypothetical protein